MNPYVKKIRSLRLAEELHYYFSSQGIKLLPFEFLEAYKMLTYNEYALCWGRGLGKSWIGTHLTVFQALRGYQWAYFCSSEDQLNQPNIYFNQNPYVEEVQHKFVIPLEGYPIPKKTVTNKNVRSGRFDGVTLDEEAALEPRQEEHLDALEGTQVASKRPIMWHLSTPIVGTRFEKTCGYLSKSQVSHRNYTNTPEVLMNYGGWINLVKINELKKKWIEQNRYWKFECEILALFSVAGGKVFVNLVIHDKHDFPYFNHMTSTGSDFHGEFGTVVVGVFNHDDFQNEVWVTHEHRYPQTNQFDFSFYNNVYSGIPNYVEGGGFNDGYARYTRSEYGCVIRESKSSEQSIRLNNALTYKIHICPELTENTYNDLISGKWDKNGLYYLKDENHPMHFGDALLISLPKSQKMGVWGHDRQTIRSTIMRQEAWRESRFGK